MAQYIDKSAVVDEIERLDNYWHLSKSVDGQAFVENLLLFLNTLEVKEVDLEKDIKNAFKAGYELGIQKAQKGGEE